MSPGVVAGFPGLVDLGFTLLAIGLIGLFIVIVGIALRS